MLELKNIHKFYNHGTINEMCLFENFNLTIDDGQFVSVVGSNGSGKTSMLNFILFSSIYFLKLPLYLDLFYVNIYLVLYVKGI